MKHGEENVLYSISVVVTYGCSTSDVFGATKFTRYPCAFGRVNKRNHDIKQAVWSGCHTRAVNMVKPSFLLTTTKCYVLFQIALHESILFSTFRKNGHTPWFDPRSKKLEPHCISEQTVPHETTKNGRKNRRTNIPPRDG